MSDLEPVALRVAENHDFLVPYTGELVDLTDPTQVAQALDHVRDTKRLLDEARALLEGALVLEAQRQGTKTLHLHKLDAVISGGERVEYDALKLQLLLRELGLPEARIAEAVVEQVTYKPNGSVLRQLAGANPDYADAIEACKTKVDVPWRVSIKR
jgi:hypothetical protein